MTMSEIRKEFTSRKKFMKATGLDGLVGYMMQMQSEVELLYKEGFISIPSDELLAYANGYQINTGNYTTMHIAQHYDLKSIAATKEAAKELAEYILTH